MNETTSPDQGAPSAATPGPDPAAHHSTTADPAPPRAGRRLVRRRDGRVLGGVCTGIADALALDVAVVRLLAVLATVMIAFGPGTLFAGVFTYAAMWFILPDERGSSAVEGLMRRLRGQAGTVQHPPAPPAPAAPPAAPAAASPPAPAASPPAAPPAPDQPTS